MRLLRLVAGLSCFRRRGPDALSLEACLGLAPLVTQGVLGLLGSPWSVAQALQAIPLGVLGRCCQVVVEAVGIVGGAVAVVAEAVVGAGSAAGVDADAGAAVVVGVTGIVGGTGVVAGAVVVDEVVVAAAAVVGCEKG